MVLLDAAEKEGVVLSDEDLQTELEEYKAYLLQMMNTKLS